MPFRGHVLPKSRLCAAVVAMVMGFGVVQLASAAPASAGPHPGNAAHPSAKGTVKEAVAAAHAAGSQVEVTSLRNERTETYANADGSFTRVDHVRPVRARVNGRWADIDETLHKDGNGVVRPAVSVLDVQIEGGKGPFLRIGRAGRTLSFTWPWALPEPTVEGDTARFSDVLPDVDLLVRADADGVSHTLMVRTKAAAADPRLNELTLKVGGSLAIKDQDSSGLRAVDGAGGGAVLEAPTPLMWDSRGSALANKRASTSDGDPDDPGGSLAEGPAEGSKVAEVDASVQGSAVNLVPNATLLDAKDTVFPVYIDPVWKTVQDAAWAMVSSGYPTTSYWKFASKSTEGMGRCLVSDDPTCVKDQTKRLFYRLPTSAYSGKQILSAEFVPYETFAFNCSNPTTVDLWRTKGFLSSSTWNSTSDNWLKKIDSRDVAHCSRTPVEFTATDSVQNAADDHSSTMTFGLRAYSESSMAWWKRFADDAFLRVHYNNPPSQPRNSQAYMDPGGRCTGPSDRPVTNTLASNLSAELRDPDGDQVQAQFKIGWDTDGDGVISEQWTSSLTTAKASGSQFTVKIPASVNVPQNRLAGWSVRAYDGAKWGPWNYDGNATSCYFTYDSTKPDAPTVTSASFPRSDPENPDDPYIDGVGRYGDFTLNAAASDAVSYTYQMNDEDEVTVSPASGGAAVTVHLMPTQAGLNFLHVKSKDRANNWSAGGTYMFRVKAGSAAKAAWSLDEPDGATQLADSSGTFPATVHDGVTLGVDGITKSAMQLNGIDGYAATAGPVVSTTSSFAVSAWAKLPTDKPGLPAVIATQAGTNRSGFELYYSSSRDRWIFNRYTADTVGASIVRAESTTAPRGGQWAHLAGVYDAVAKTLTLYVNGKKAGSASYTTPWNATGPVQIGAGWYGDRESFFSGEIDDVRVFDRVVSSDEVRDLFTQHPEVAARWKMNDTGIVIPAPKAGYRLDEAGGATRAEDTQGAAPAGAHGGVTFGVAGPSSGSGTAASLNGSSGYLATSGSIVNTTESFSVSAWAKLSATKPKQTGIIATQAGQQRSGFELYYSAHYDRWIFNRYDKDATTAAIVRAQSTSVPKTGVWTHLVGVYDATAQQLRLFVNGRLEGSETYTTPWSATGPLQIGAGWYGSRSSYFLGDVDDVRVFGQALSDSTAVVLGGGSPTALSADDGPHGDHVQMQGGAAIDAGAGWVGDPPGGMVLDGADDYAASTGPVIDTGQSFSVAGWVNLAGAPDHKVTVFSQAGAMNSGFVVRYDPAVASGTGGFQIEMDESDDSGARRSLADNPNFEVGGWNHVTLVYDAFAAQMRLYVNGSLAQIEDQVSYRSDVAGFASSQGFQIGRSKTGGAWGEYLPGVVDDVWAFDGALSDEQVQTLAGDPLELPTEPGP